ncbi:YpoC family protein [Bacillus sp. AK031]
MGEAISLPIPVQLMNSLFFNDDEKGLLINMEEKDSLKPVFSFEFLYYNDIPLQILPWENTDEVKRLEESWQTLRLNLNQAFSARAAAEIEEHMKNAIACFLMYLFWTNGLPANAADWKEELPKLHVKPVNAGERLEFVFMQPSLFHSYKQLDQLFTEQIKQFAKHLAISQSK